MPRGRQSNDSTNNMLGMLGMGGAGAPNMDDEADLNAELEALLSGKAPPPARRRGKAAPGAMGAPRAGPGPGAGSDMSLEAQVAMALKDVPDDFDDGDLEDDPELLAELQGIVEEGEEEMHEEKGSTGCSERLVEERLEQYQMATAMAESMGENAKARRYKRGIANLEDLLSRARKGQTVQESELPPPVSAHLSPSSESEPPAPKAARPDPPPPPAVSPQKDKLPMLNERRDQYKIAALTAKRAGEINEAKRLIQVAKQFDAVISAIEAGQSADLSAIPPPPSLVNQAPAPASAPEPVQTEARQRSAPANSLSLEEDLRARMGVLQKTRDKAEAEGNASKARRYGRQLTAYKTAITACKKGEQFDYSELALPPGFEALSSTASSPVSPSQPTPSSLNSAPSASQNSAPAHAPAPAPTPAPAPAPATGSEKTLLEDLQERMAIMQKRAQQQEDPSKARRMGRVVNAYKEAIAACKAGRSYAYSDLAVPPNFAPLPNSAADAPARAAGGAGPDSGPVAVAAAGAGVATSAGQPAAKRLQRSLSRSTNQTLVFLQERQKLFKEAALKAKNEGKKDLALTYLRQSKGFDPMIAAAENGLPVDMSKLPALPGEKEVDFGFLKADECENPDDFDTSNPKDLYKQLTQKLQTQVQMCKANSLRCSRMGDVTTASKFDRLIKTCMLDLAALRSCETHGDEVPRFHFEWKTFTIEQNNPDLAEDALELQLVRGIDLAVPSGYSPESMDTYLRVELPFPSSDEPQTFSTDVVRRTNNPEFNATHKFSINRKQRTFQRLIKSRAVKVEVYYKRGFLKGDKVLGVASAKLGDLETKCEVHDSFDLMEGRKAIGGRVEVRVRIREPTNGRQVEETREKWLVIDATAHPEPTADRVASTAPQTAMESSEVMRYEMNLLVQRMQNLKSQLTPTMTRTLDAKRQELERKIAAQTAMLEKGNPQELRRYVEGISKLLPSYNAEARERLKAGDREKASVLMTKKKLVEKEVAAIRARMTARK